jgi:hypothetical protein
MELNKGAFSMATEKRRRGRPPGSGKDDLRWLERAADLMVSEPGLKPTTALNRTMPGREDRRETDATLRRRGQVKWKVQRESLLAAARERARLAATAPMTFYFDFDLSGAVEGLRSYSDAAMLLFGTIRQSLESLGVSITSDKTR